MKVLIRSLMTVRLLPLILVLSVLQLFVRIAVRLSSAAFLLLILLIFTCFAMTVFHCKWDQALLLFLMETGVVLAWCGAGLIDAVLERAAGQPVGFMRG